MDQGQDGDNRVDHNDELLALAKQLRQAAMSAHRTDVAAKADEAIALLTVTTPANTAANTITRLLNGLGF